MCRCGRATLMALCCTLLPCMLQDRAIRLTLAVVIGASGCQGGCGLTHGRSHHIASSSCLKLAAAHQHADVPVHTRGRATLDF